MKSLPVKFRRFWYLRPTPELVDLGNLSSDQIGVLKVADLERYTESWEKLVGNENTLPAAEPRQKVVAIRRISEIIPGLLVFPQWVMDRFKEALDQYVRGEWMSSIVLCGLVVEFVISDLFGVYRDRIPQREKLSDIAKMNLIVLKSYGVLDDDDYQRLDDVRNLRNRYVHPRKLPTTSQQKEDNFFALRKMCEFFSEGNMAAKYGDYFSYAAKLARRT